MSEQPPEEQRPAPQYYSPPPGIVPGSTDPGSPPVPPAYRPPASTPSPEQQGPTAPAPSTEYVPPPQSAYTVPAAYPQPVFTAPATEPPVVTPPPAPPAKPSGLAGLLPAGLTPTMAAIYAALGVVAIVALFVGVVLYNGAARKDTDQRVAAADRAMRQVVRNEAKVGDNLKAAFEPEKGPESPTKNYNGDSVRQAIKDVTPAMEKAAKTVEADQSTMRTATSSFNDRGFLSFTSGAVLDKKAAQMDALNNALGVRADEAATAKQQLVLLGDLTTAEDNFNGLAQALDRKDLVTATSRYTPSRNAINQAVTDAQQSNTPDAVRTYVNDVSGFMDATQTVINSLQNRDLGEYAAALRVFTTKLENLAANDPKTMRRQYDDLTKSYDDRYNSYLHDAGFLTGTKAV